MYCKHCGKELSQGSFTCGGCGKFTEPPTSIEMTTEKYEAMEKHYKETKFNWEPNNIFSMIIGGNRNKYTKQEKKRLTQLCMLCGFTTTVGEMFHVPDSTLKTWVYKAKKISDSKREEWVEVLSTMGLNSRIKILADMYSIDVAAKLTKLPNGIIEKVVKGE